MLRFEVLAMPGSWQITCISKTSGSDPFERIGRVGGPEGEGWTLSVDEIIAHINKGTSFWVDIAGRRVDVVISNNCGRTYIKTRTDADAPDCLLSLPECVD